MIAVVADYCQVSLIEFALEGEGQSVCWLQFMNKWGTCASERNIYKRTENTRVSKILA